MRHFIQQLAARACPALSLPRAHPAESPRIHQFPTPLFPSPSSPSTTPPPHHFPLSPPSLLFNRKLGTSIRTSKFARTNPPRMSRNLGLPHEWWARPTNG